jgi:hypothetical protein
MSPWIDPDTIVLPDTEPHASQDNEPQPASLEECHIGAYVDDMSNRAFSYAGFRNGDANTIL